MANRRKESTRPSREERRAQLLDAAVDAIREIGPSASMELLAARGGVTKPILYRHFGDREGLARAIGERFAHILTARLAESLTEAEPQQLLWRTIDAYLSFLEGDPNLYAFLTESDAGPESVTSGGIVDAIARQVAITIGDGLRAAGADAGAAEPYAFGIIGMVHQAGDWWMRNRTMSRQALTTYLADLLWRGFEGLASPVVSSAAPAGDTAT